MQGKNTTVEFPQILNQFGGDSGSGGAQGTVPAPAAGDATAGKYLAADGTWSVPPGGGIKTAVVTLTAAQLKALKGTPVQLIAAPGAGKAICVTGAAFQYKYGTAAYTLPSTPHLYLSTGAQANDGVMTAYAEVLLNESGFLDQAASQFAYENANTPGGAQTLFANLPLMAMLPSDASGENTVGDGLLTISILYLIVTLS